MLAVIMQEGFKECSAWSFLEASSNDNFMVYADLTSDNLAVVKRSGCLQDSVTFA